MVHHAMKRSIAPIFWLMFGAGGMLAALFGPALVTMTGLAMPTGVGFSPGLMDHAHAVALARHPLGKLVLLAVIALFAWHGAERIYLTLKDMHLGPKLTLAWLSYGSAGTVTLAAIAALLAIGF
jgi:fumarate reductase subunit D